MCIPERKHPAANPKAMPIRILTNSATDVSESYAGWEWNSQSTHPRGSHELNSLRWYKLPREQGDQPHAANPEAMPIRILTNSATDVPESYAGWEWNSQSTLPRGSHEINSLCWCKLPRQQERAQAP